MVELTFLDERLPVGVAPEVYRLSPAELYQLAMALREIGGQG